MNAAGKNTNTHDNNEPSSPLHTTQRARPHNAGICLFSLCLFASLFLCFSPPPCLSPLRNHQNIIVGISVLALGAQLFPPTPTTTSPVALSSSALPRVSVVAGSVISRISSVLYVCSLVVQIAAANAMTVLCRSGRSFAGTDLSRIKVLVLRSRLRLTSVRTHG